MAIETTPLQLHCEGCGKEGFISLNKNADEENIFVVCSNCKTETAEVWCPNCKMGGQFVKAITKHPSAWRCPQCKTKHTLKKSFYNSPRYLYFYDNLPSELKSVVNKLNLPTPVESAKREISRNLAIFAIAYVVLFLIQSNKSLQMFLINIDVVFGAWVAVSALSVPPRYVGETGITVTSKKVLAANKWAYYLVTALATTGITILFLNLSLGDFSRVNTSGDMLAIILFIGILSIISLSNALYAFTFKVYPHAGGNDVYFYKHKNTSKIAITQAIFSLIVFIWIYFRITI